MSKTKEEAYQKATAQNLSDPNGTRMDVIYSAMDIYARNTAIAFSDWCAQNYGQYELGKWENGLDETFTTDQLYDIFVTHQSQQK